LSGSKQSNPSSGESYTRRGYGLGGKSPERYPVNTGHLGRLVYLVNSVTSGVVPKRTRGSQLKSVTKGGDHKGHNIL